MSRFALPVRRMLLLSLAGLLMSGCSCKAWNNCPRIFPNAERFAPSQENVPNG